MQSLFFLAILLLFSVQVNAQDNSPSITTMQISADGVDFNDIISFNNTIAAALETVAGYRVISPDELSSLKEQRDVVLECTEVSCYAQTASNLGIDFVLSAVLSKSAEGHSVEIFVVDASTAQKVVSMGTTFTGSVNDFSNNLSFLARNVATEALPSHVAGDASFLEQEQDTRDDAKVDDEIIEIGDRQGEDLQGDDFSDNQINEHGDEDRRFNYHIGFYGHITSHYRGPSPGLGARLGVSDFERSRHYVGVLLEVGYTPVHFYFDENWSVGVAAEYFFRMFGGEKWSFKPGVTVGYWYIENRYFTVDREHYDVNKYDMFGGVAIQAERFFENGHSLFTDFATILGTRRANELEGNQTNPLERPWSMIRFRFGYNFNI